MSPEPMSAIASRVLREVAAEEFIVPTPNGTDVHVLWAGAGTRVHGFVGGRWLRGRVASTPDEAASAAIELVFCAERGSE